MARITVEDCLEKINNRFKLIHVAAKRVRQLRKGTEPTIVSKNRDVVIALREIAAGNVINVETVDQKNLTGDKVDILPEDLEEKNGGEAPNDEKKEGELSSNV
ncbi:MAG: DNA-directed RNA polymerase subunit omega [Deltaproteobacteria bacterium]|nr:DNA-directed RNA polymerase subunit omega [Deltaproteobacteria bacterium]